jgi:hypothetical protein
MGKGRGYEGRQQEVVSLPRVVPGDTQSGLQHILCMVVKGDALRYFAEVPVPPKIHVLRI